MQKQNQTNLYLITFYLQSSTVQSKGADWVSEKVTEWANEGHPVNRGASHLTTVLSLDVTSINIIQTKKAYRRLHYIYKPKM